MYYQVLDKPKVNKYVRNTAVSQPFYCTLVRSMGQVISEVNKEKYKIEQPSSIRRVLIAALEVASVHHLVAFATETRQKQTSSHTSVFCHDVACWTSAAREFKAVLE